MIDIKDKTVLVTGGEGFLGRAIVDKLLEKGAKSISQGWILGSMYNKWKRIKDSEKANKRIF